MSTVSGLYFLFACTGSRAVRTTFRGIATVTGIVYAYFIVRALDPGNPTACSWFRWFAYTCMVDRNTCRRRSARIAIGLAITTADRHKFLGAYGRLGFAGTLCIRNFALASTKIAVLSCWASQPPNGSAYRILGRWDWIWLVITPSQYKGKTTSD